MTFSANATLDVQYLLNRTTSKNVCAEPGLDEIESEDSFKTCVGTNQDLCLIGAVACETTTTAPTQPTYSCPSGETLSGNVCTKQVKDCRYGHKPSYYVNATYDACMKTTWYWNNSKVASFSDNNFYKYFEYNSYYAGTKIYTQNGFDDDDSYTLYQLCHRTTGCLSTSKNYIIFYYCGNVEIYVNGKRTAKISLGDKAKYLKYSNYSVGNLVSSYYDDDRYETEDLYYICKTSTTTSSATASCPSGQFLNSDGYCVKEVPTCPIDSSLSCINYNSNYYCSANQCAGIDAIEEAEGDVDGLMYNDDGEVSSDGVCLGSTLIYNGRRMRCKRSGVQTAWQNCCDESDSISTDNSGDSLNTSIKHEAIMTSISQIYKGAQAAYGIIQAGGSASSAVGAFGSNIIAFDPTSLAVSVAIAIITNWAANACDDMDLDTALSVASSRCVYLGKYCNEKWLGSCVQSAQSYCCFNSQMSALVHKYGRIQLDSFKNLANNGFGSLSKPECRGFTPEEFQQLDFSKIDLTEYYETLTHGNLSEMNDKVFDKTEEFINNVQ